VSYKKREPYALRETRRLPKLFSEVLSILKAIHEPERVISLIVDRIVRMYGCQTCAIIIIDPSTEYLRVFFNHNLSHL